MDPSTIEQLNMIRQSAGRERDKLDKLIFAITAGTLSLSITFIAKSGNVFAGLPYLYASWVVLLFSLLAVLFGYTFAILYFREFESGVKEGRFADFSDAEKIVWFRLVELCNWLSLFATIVGIALFAYFGYLNTL